MKLIEGGLIIPLIRYHLYFGKLILATAAIFRSSHEFPASLVMALIDEAEAI